MRQEGRGKKQFNPKIPAPLKFEVEAASELLLFLLAKLPQKSRNNVKVLLRDKNIYVDGEVITQYNHVLKIGQNVEIKWEKRLEDQKLRGLRIIFEDQLVAPSFVDSGGLRYKT
jgi:23S rRNA pseudouridine1911/1915/1917 synthase